MILRDANTGGLQVYGISNNQFTNSAFMGVVGLDWRIEGFGDFSSRPGETDMLMRNVNTGGLLLYDIADNQITGANFSVRSASTGSSPALHPSKRPAPPTWSCATSAPAHSKFTTLPTIKSPEPHPQAKWDRIGKLGGFAPSSPTSSMGSSDAASNAQLVQAMAGFGGSSGATDSLKCDPCRCRHVTAAPLLVRHRSTHESGPTIGTAGYGDKAEQSASRGPFLSLKRPFRDGHHSGQSTSLGMFLTIRWLEQPS